MPMLASITFLNFMPLICFDIICNTISYFICKLTTKTQQQTTNIVFIISPVAVQKDTKLKLCTFVLTLFEK